jgi:hypothetical protein
MANKQSRGHALRKSDGALIEEGVHGIRIGRWVNPNEAARALAERAIRNGTRFATIERLRKKIRDGLTSQAP